MESKVKITVRCGRKMFFWGSRIFRDTTGSDTPQLQLALLSGTPVEFTLDHSIDGEEFYLRIEELEDAK